MQRHVSLLGLLLTIGMAAPAASGQAAGWVLVETNEPSAHVYLDSIYVGVAAEGAFQHDSGPVVVKLVPAERSNWSIAPVEDHVQVVQGDTAVVQLPFPVYYRIESVPYGADVVLREGDEMRLMGKTPLTFHVPGPLKAPISVEKSGYISARIDPGAERWNRHLVPLEQAPRTEGAVAGAEVPWSPPRSIRTTWIDYAAIGIAVVSGVAAVHYKFKADDLYERYEKTGDPMLEDRIRSLDIRSGIALGTMQVGLGVFAIRLALK